MFTTMGNSCWVFQEWKSALVLQHCAHDGWGMVGWLLRVIIFVIFIEQTFQRKNRKLRVEPWSSGFRRRLVSWRLWVWIPALYTVWTFFTFICCKNWNFCLRRWNKWKRGRGLPIFKENKKFPNVASRYIVDLYVLQFLCR